MTHKALCLDSCNSQIDHSLKFIEKYDDEQLLIKSQVIMDFVKLMKLILSYLESNGFLYL